MAEKDIQATIHDFKRRVGSASDLVGSTTGGGGGTYDGMEARVSHLEKELTDIKVTLARLDEKLTAMNLSLASKADVAEIKGKLDGKLGLWQFLTVVGVLLGIMTRWPELFRLLH